MDLNSIENLWNYLDYKVWKRKLLSKIKQELINAIKEEWEKISLEILHRLILSLSNYINKIIKAKGRYTKY